MQYFLNSRLQVYDKLICKYDILDKEFLVNTNFIFKLDFSKINFSLDFTKNQNFTIVLNEEFLALQKVSFQGKSEKLNVSFIKAIITLRKLNLYWYLELLLHTEFFNKNTFFNLGRRFYKYTFLTKKFNNFFMTQFLSNLDFYIFFNKNILLSLFFKNINNSKSQINYYFIPNS